MKLRYLLYFYCALVTTSPVMAEVEIGSTAANFSLHDINNTEVSLESLKGKYVVLEWFNIGCPYVRKHYKNNDMQLLQKEFTAKNIIWLTINSTNKNHQDYRDTESTKKLMTKLNSNSSNVILDDSGELGKSFGAKTTPHMFILNPKGVLIYRGAIDDTADVDADPKQTLNHIHKALTAILENKPLTTAETKAYGCSIKYAE